MYVILTNIEFMLLFDASEGVTAANATTGFVLSIVNVYVADLLLLVASSQQLTLTNWLSPADTVTNVEFKVPEVALVVVLVLPIVILQPNPPKEVSILSVAVQLTFSEVELWFVLFAGAETVIVGASVSENICILYDVFVPLLFAQSVTFIPRV